MVMLTTKLLSLLLLCAVPASATLVDAGFDGDPSAALTKETELAKNLQSQQALLQSHSIQMMEDMQKTLDVERSGRSDSEKQAVETESKLASVVHQLEFANQQLAEKSQELEDSKVLLLKTDARVMQDREDLAQDKKELASMRKDFNEKDIALSKEADAMRRLQGDVSALRDQAADTKAAFKGQLEELKQDDNDSLQKSKAMDAAVYAEVLGKNKAMEASNNELGQEVFQEYKQIHDLKADGVKAKYAEVANHKMLTAFAQDSDVLVHKMSSMAGSLQQARKQVAQLLPVQSEAAELKQDMAQLEDINAKEEDDLKSTIAKSETKQGTIAALGAKLKQTVFMLQSERKAEAKSNALVDSSRSALLHGKELLKVRDELLRKEAGLVRQSKEDASKLRNQLSDTKEAALVEKQAIAQAWNKKLVDTQAKNTANEQTQEAELKLVGGLKSSVTAKSIMLVAAAAKEKLLTRSLETSSEEVANERRDLKEMKMQLEAGDDAEANVEQELLNTKEKLDATTAELIKSKKRSSSRAQKLRNLSTALIKEHKENVEFHKGLPQAMHFDLPEVMLNSPEKKAKFLQYAD